MIYPGMTPQEARKFIEEGYGRVWDKEQLKQDFEVLSFAGGFCHVKRLSDGAYGSLDYTHHPRLYFGFVRSGA